MIMSRIIETQVFRYEELSDEAQAQARDWWREGGLDYEWWDSVYELAETAATCLDITVDRRGNGLAIEFSGFWSQGDGASFTGSYHYRKGWKKALRAEFHGLC